MKKVLSLIFTLCLLITAFSVGASCLMCDVNDDGSVTAADARLALRCSVGLEELSEEALKCADADFNGKITALDARYILRMSVGLEKAPVSSQNDYEIMQSGEFSLKCGMTDSAGVYSEADIYITADSVYMVSDFSGVEIGMLVKDEVYYMIYDDEAAVLQLSESVLLMAGLSPDDLIDNSYIDFTEYPDFTDLELLKTEEYKGQQCTVYSVSTEAEYTEIYMCGDTMVRMIGCTPDGTFLCDIEVFEVSPEVPAEKTEVPSEYKLYKGIGGMFKFMSLLEM